MPPEAEQGNGSQGQESGTGTQGDQGQESGTQNGGQGQASGGQQGTEGTEGQGQEPDFSTMSEAELREYAARTHKTLGQTRAEAARYRTAHQEAQGKLTEAEREKMSEAEKVQADLATAQTQLQTVTEENTSLKAQVEDLTKGVGIREALAGVGALNPVTAFKVGSWSDVKLKEDGSVDKESFLAAVTALKTSDPYLFRRGASADGGAGGGGTGAPEGGSSINDMIRGNARR